MGQRSAKAEHIESIMNQLRTTDLDRNLETLRASLWSMTEPALLTLSVAIGQKWVQGRRDMEKELNERGPNLSWNK